VSDPRRPQRATLALLFTGGLTLTGCPAAPPPVMREATLNPSELPADPAELVKYIDEEEKKQTAAAEENEVIAVDKGLEKDPKDYELLWRGARACAWLTEEFPNKDQRASWAERGIKYAKRAVAVNGGRVEGHYYLGINIGQSARTKTIGAYLMVPKVVKEGQIALKIDEKFDHGGPGRLVGNVYAKAPPWPASIGDTDEGVGYLRRVVEIAPDFPQNHLHYADALYADGKYAEAAKEYQIVLDMPLKLEWQHAGEQWKKDAAKGLQKVAEKQKGS